MLIEGLTSDERLSTQIQRGLLRAPVAVTVVVSMAGTAFGRGGLALSSCGRRGPTSPIG